MIVDEDFQLSSLFVLFCTQYTNKYSFQTKLQQTEDKSLEWTLINQVGGGRLLLVLNLYQYLV